MVHIKEILTSEHYLSRIGMDLDSFCDCAGDNQCAKCAERREAEAERKLDERREQI